MNDNGYDISNYYKINERFGTIEDLKTLIAKAHQRNLKIMMDIVINHTSTDHEWFKKPMKIKKAHIEIIISLDALQTINHRQTGNLNLGAMPGNMILKQNHTIYICSM